MCTGGTEEDAEEAGDDGGFLVGWGLGLGLVIWDLWLLVFWSLSWGIGGLMREVWDLWL